ncbi:MAG: pilus assembly protein PilM [candidate division KSB1 bacterium]|nr:pilus assembly protein PilM [candidate division KSB1 bacterium]
MNENSILGVSFSRDAIQFVEAEMWEDAPSITNIAETKLDVPLDANAFKNSELIPHFATLIDNTVDSSSLHARDVRLSLYQNLALIKSFPMETALQDQDIRHHIEWELEQSLISPRDHYNVGFEIYSQNNSKSAVIVAALRKSVIHYVQDIFKKSLVSLKSIDIDLTAELRALNRLGGSAMNGINVLVHYDGLYFQLALLKNGTFVSSFFVDTQLSADALADNEETAGSVIVNAVQNLCEHNGLDQSDVKALFLSGHPLDKGSFSTIQQTVDQSVKKADSFEALNRQLNLEAEEYAKNTPEKFLAAVGMVFEDTGGN